MSINPSIRLDMYIDRQHMYYGRFIYISINSILLESECARVTVSELILQFACI